MSDRYKLAAKWGLWIGLANMAWLYLAFFFGLHTNGIMIFQVFMLVWLILSVSGHVMALRRFRNTTEGISFGEGLAFGAVASIVSAFAAVVAQVGYYKVVNPKWTETMVGQTRDHFEKAGMSPTEVDKMAAQAEQSFTLTNYAISSAITAFALGLVVSAVAMAYLRRRTVATS